MNLKGKAELTGRETLVMKCVWNHKGDISAVEIQRALKETYGMEFERSTITTFILHLREKGYLDSYKKGQIHYYVPLVKEEDYARQQVKNFTDFWFHGSVSKLVSAFTGNDPTIITDEEIQRIRKVIDELDE